jgi:membrane associated rhomboid family serine protease
VSVDSQLFNFREKIESSLVIVFFVFLIVFSLSILTYIADMEAHIFNKYLVVNNLLSASQETPWGIFTSLFTHINESHIINNIINLTIYLVILVAINSFLPKREMKRRIFTSSIFMFLVPIFSNLFLILSIPEIKISGSSSIVYTVIGLCLGFSFFNSLKIRVFKNGSRRERSISLLFFSSNILVFLSVLFNAILIEELIFGFFKDYKILIHTLPFFGGLICSFVVLWIFKISR